jgi:hypothetical protein
VTALLWEGKEGVDPQIAQMTQMAAGPGRGGLGRSGQGRSGAWEAPQYLAAHGSYA